MIDRLQPGSQADSLREVCVRRFGSKPDNLTFINAPYRICPIGAHIDHQLGPVSAIAVNQGIEIAFASDSARRIRIESEGYGGVEISLDNLSRRHDWGDYARGAATALALRKPLSRGAAVAVAGALAESGISSSAAIGLGYLKVLADTNGFTLSQGDLIELDRVIENEFLGLKNGVLDQSAITLARAGSLTIIDCEKLEHQYVEQDSAFEFLVVYSGLREALIDSGKFNSRVDESLAAGALLIECVTGRRSEPTPLGRISRKDWRDHEVKLDAVSQKRARHFFTESERVLAGAEAWQQGDRDAFGSLMIDSCLSSINNYETGSPEMIRLFEALTSASGVYGARFSGAGFRGCAIALVDPGSVDAILEEVECAYLASFPQFAGKLWSFQTTAQDGLRVL